jgi:indolepyruvate ferredoxin oxidoreductase beta subunit
VAECQRLVKGYSDTHERGVRNYDLVMDALQRAGSALAPATLRELRDAALADEHGDRLRAVLARYALA